MTLLADAPSQDRRALWVAMLFLFIVAASILVIAITGERETGAKFAAFALHGMFFALLWLRPEAALYFLMAAAPLEPMLRAWAGTRYLTFAYGLIFLMLRQPRVSLRRLLPLDISFVFFLIYCIWTIVTIAWARERRLAVTSSALMWGLLATVAAARALIDDEKHLRTVLGFLIFGAVVSLALHVVTISDARDLRLGAHRNMSPQDVTSVFVVGLLAIFYLQTQKHILLWWLTIVALSSGIVLAVSRTNIVALLVGVATFFLLAPRRLTRVIPALLLPLLLASVVLFASDWNPTAYDARIERTLHAENVDQFTTGRVSIWRVATEMIRDNALLGVGAGGFGREFDRYLRRTPIVMRYGREPGTHSLPLQAAAESGVPAALFLIAFLVATVIQAWRSRRRLPAVGAVAVALSLACIVTSASAAVHQTPLWFGLGLGAWALHVAPVYVARQPASVGLLEPAEPREPVKA